MLTNVNTWLSILSLLTDSCQTPVRPESPVPGPCGLAAYGRSDECVPWPETFGEERPLKNTRCADTFVVLLIMFDFMSPFTLKQGVAILVLRRI